MVTFYSVERVQENGGFQSAFEEEIRRVMVHGVLHYCGYKDGRRKELLMRSKEDENWLVPRNSKSYLCFK
jgi:ssRNA-specific RNase YbeY (16S rRNA maturation enzyme)